MARPFWYSSCSHQIIRNVSVRSGGAQDTKESKENYREYDESGSKSVSCNKNESEESRRNRKRESKGYFAKKRRKY